MPPADPSSTPSTVSRSAAQLTMSVAAIQPAAMPQVTGRARIARMFALTSSPASAPYESASHPVSACEPKPAKTTPSPNAHAAPTAA